MAKLKLLYRDPSNLLNVFLLPRVYLDGGQLGRDVLRRVATCRDPTARGFGPSGFARKQNKSCFEVVVQGTFEGIPSSASTASRSRFGVAMEIASI
jgi:hypothetical protein